MKKCPYCAEEIQDDAIVCKYCKSDLTKLTPSTKSVQTIELTSKKYKKKYLYSSLLIVIGLMMTIGGFGRGSTAAGVIGSFLMLIGIILFIVTKVQVWWHHK